MSVIVALIFDTGPAGRVRHACLADCASRVRLVRHACLADCAGRVRLVRHACRADRAGSVHHLRGVRFLRLLLVGSFRPS